MNGRITEYDCYRELVEKCEIRFFESNNDKKDMQFVDKAIVEILIRLREIRIAKSNIRNAKREQKNALRRRFWSGK